MPTQKKLKICGAGHGRMLEKLKESGLDANDAKKLGFKAMNATECQELGLSRAGEGFKIPYYDSQGNELPMFRYRYYDTEVEGGFLAGAKLRKYDQPLNTDPEIYLPQLVDWETIKKDSNKLLLVTEGEIKAACATKQGFATIGLGGVFNFGSRKKFQWVLPSLESFDWRQRHVYIVFDSDAATNPNVLLAEQRLARELTDRNAMVHIVSIPADGPDKVGLDDFIVKQGKEALGELLEKSAKYIEYEALHQLNTEVVFIEHPPQVLFLPKENHPDEQPRNRIVSTEDFVKIYADRKWHTLDAASKPVVKKAGKEWLEWSGRAKVDSLTYAPGEPIVTENNQFNIWQPSGVERRAGDVGPFLDLVEFLVPDPETREWFLSWLASPLQNLGAKLTTAVVMVSPQGMGKSSVTDTMRAVYGENNAIEIDQRVLDSQFNRPLACRQLIVGEEITGRKQRENADVLKHLITGRTILVNEKFKPPVVLPNCANFIFLTNHADAFHLEDTDRRFCVLQGPRTPRPPEYYVRFHDWLKNGGASYVLDHLLQRDLSAFNPHGHAPRTAAKDEMIAASRTGIAAWVHDLREDPDSVTIDRDQQFPRVLSLHTAAELLEMFGSGRNHRFTAKSLTLALRAAGFEMACDGEVVRLGEFRRRLWITRPCPEIAKMREAHIAKLFHEERRTQQPKKFTRLAAVGGGR